jgi:hypothetical protein
MSPLQVTNDNDVNRLGAWQGGHGVTSSTPFES